MKQEDLGDNCGYCQGCKACLLSELQRISRGGCGRELLVELSTKVLEEVNKSSCVATTSLIAYVVEGVLGLFWEVSRNCVKEDITVQHSCSRRNVLIADGVFIVDEGENCQECSQNSTLFTQFLFTS